MGLQKQPCFSAQCDKCKKDYVNGSEFSIFPDKIGLMEELSDSEWVNQNGNLLCPSCEDYEEQNETLSRLGVTIQVKEPQ